MNIIKLLGVVSAIIFVGCKSLYPTVPRISFPLSEYKALKQKGTGIIKGQAFLKTRGGDVKKAAGNIVMLNPVTSYSHQWYNVSYLQQKNIAQPDLRNERYIIKTIADAEGKFEFIDVPPGNYYLVTHVFWEAPVGPRGAMEVQGSYIAKKVEVRNGNSIKVILTK